MSLDSEEGEKGGVTNKYESGILNRELHHEMLEYNL